jgi:hypothetical protein
MNTTQRDFRWLIVTLMIVLTGWTGFGAVTSAPLVYSEGFEGQAHNASLTNLAANGWDASLATVVIQTNLYHSGSKAVAFPDETAASNLVETVSNVSNVWSEVFLYQTNYVADDWIPDGDTNLTVEFAITSNGTLRLFEPVSGLATNFTTDHWGTNMAVFATSPWQRITLNQNYQTKRAAIFLNTHLICEQLRFINTNKTAHGFYCLDNGPGGTAGLDDFARSTNVLSSLTGVDRDGDGKDDAEEIQAYGNVERWIGIRSVPSPYTTIQAAIAAAAPGEIIGIAANTYVQNLDVSNSVSFIGTNVTVNGGISLEAGVTLTLSAVSNMVITGNVAVVPGSAMVVSNGSVTLSTVTGGDVQFVNSSLTVNGLVRKGTFSWNALSGTLQPSVVPWADTFEGYGDGTMVAMLGDRGWGASYTGVTVKAGVGNPGQGVYMAPDPAVTVVSNVVDDTQGVANGATNLWLLIDSKDKVPSDWVVGEDSASSFMMYVNSGGYVVVYDKSLPGWAVCTTDVQGNVVTNLTADEWAHMAVNLNYGTHKAAVFLNGRLIRQMVGFNNTSYSSCRLLSVENGAVASAAFDNVALTNGVPASLTSDLDQDTIPDALEIQQNGDVTAYPRGSIFKIR